MRRACPCWAALVLIVLPCALAATGIDPRKVSVLYTGDPYPGITPYLSMKEDAFISVTPVQASSMHYAGITSEDIRKAMRIYMARSYDDYVNKYDVMILSDSNRGVFTSGQIFWFRDGVLDHGIGLLMVGGYESFGGGFNHPSWAGSPVEEVLPVLVPQGLVTWVSGNVRIEPVKYDNPFMASLPFRPTPEYMRIGTDGNFVIQKEGSELLARWISTTYNDPPCYVTWEVGKGRTFAMMHDWTPGGGYWMSRWDYYRDFAVNLMLYLAGRQLPTDYLVVHEYRSAIHSISVSKGLLMSLIDFVDSFGGNPREIDSQIIVLNAMVAESQEYYLDHRFEEALERAQLAIEKVKEIEQLSVRIKNQALLWVYVVEWLSVTGVSLLAGVVVWSLMVRRRLYREVRVTRLKEVM